MHINLESKSQYSVQAYTETSVKIDEVCYQNSLILSPSKIQESWNIENISQLEDSLVDALLEFKPEIIIIGHAMQGKFAPLETRASLAQLQIGLETMSIGAACRTYNVLESEGRKVVLGLIFS